MGWPWIEIVPLYDEFGNLIPGNEGTYTPLDSGTAWEGIINELRLEIEEIAALVGTSAVWTRGVGTPKRLSVLSEDYWYVSHIQDLWDNLNHFETVHLYIPETIWSHDPIVPKYDGSGNYLGDNFTPVNEMSIIEEPRTAVEVLRCILISGRSSDGGD